MTLAQNHRQRLNGNNIDLFVVGMFFDIREVMLISYIYSFCDIPMYRIFVYE